MVKIRQAIVVEGRYDKNTLSLLYFEGRKLPAKMCYVQGERHAAAVSA